MRSHKAISSNSRSTRALRRQHDGDAPSPSSCSGISNGYCFRRVGQETEGHARRPALQIRGRGWEWGGQAHGRGEVVWSAQENEAGVTVLGNSGRWTSRVAADSRWVRGNCRWRGPSSTNTDGQHRGFLSSGHEFARKSGMPPFRRPLGAMLLVVAPSLHAARASRTFEAWTLPLSGLRSTGRSCSWSMQFCLAGWSWSACISPRQSATSSGTLRFWTRQSGWLHAARVRVAAPSNDTSTWLDSAVYSLQAKKVIHFFVVSEELHSSVRTVPVDENPTVIRTHQLVVSTQEWSAGFWSGRPPSFAEVLDMVSECGQREPWCAQRWTRLPCNGSARWKRKSSAGTTLSTRTGTKAGWQCLHATATASDQAWTWTGRGRRRCTLELTGAARRTLAQRACEGTHGQGSQSHLQHTSQDLQPKLAFFARPARYVELVEELAEKFGAMDGREAPGCAANLHAGGWSGWACSVSYSGAGLERLGFANSDGWWCAAGASLDQVGGALGGRVCRRKMCWQSGGKNRLIWWRRNGTIFGRVVERVRSFLVVSTMLPSYHLYLLTTCATSVVRSVRTLLLLPTTCTRLSTWSTSAVAIAMILTLAANVGYCPAVFATIIMVLLPKTTGGWRAIGLSTSVLRVYLRWTRRAVTSSWERGLSRRTGSGRLRTPVHTRPGGSAWQAPYRWTCGCEARFPALAFPNRCVRRTEPPVENVATTVARSGGSAVVPGCVHATTLMKLVLVDSVDHTRKKLPSLFAAVVDDTQSQAVGKSHQVSQQLQRAIRLFTEHAEEVEGLVVSSKELETITNDERTRTDAGALRSHEELGGHFKFFFLKLWNFGFSKTTSFFLLFLFRKTKNYQLITEN